MDCCGLSFLIWLGWWWTMGVVFLLLYLLRFLKLSMLKLWWIMFVNWWVGLNGITLWRFWKCFLWFKSGTVLMVWFLMRVMLRRFMSDFYLFSLIVWKTIVDWFLVWLRWLLFVGRAVWKLELVWVMIGCWCKLLSCWLEVKDSNWIVCFVLMMLKLDGWYFGCVLKTFDVWMFIWCQLLSRLMIYWLESRWDVMWVCGWLEFPEVEILWG